ncbi:hypothetical protein [Nocardia sp. alder85J]|uniref:hypothetical protein n=1 Tax=Nocardia sp. alder85J TaxID=2862949 RepID=UPI002250A240|nr:hypothetical protein [Nocardia sp. alder85J]MCX4095449.1 hypothetical protein [Nocardia sp. alder85J]
MGWFGRRQRRDPGTDPRDPAFSFLSADEGRRFRATMREVLAERGIEGVVSETHLTTMDGAQLGFYNIAAYCHSYGGDPGAWPALIGEHLDRLFAERDSDPMDLPVDELLPTMYPRVVPDFQMQYREEFRYGPEVAEGLWVVLALDRPDTVTTMPDTAVAELGGFDLLWPRAMENLRGLPIPERHTFGRREGGWFHAVVDDSYFTASRVLILDELLSRMNVPFGDDGVLVTMPNRTQLVFRPLDGTPFAPAVHDMTDFTIRGYVDTPGLVSPHLYWWRRGELTQLTQHEDDRMTFDLPADFRALLDRHEP